MKKNILNAVTLAAAGVFLAGCPGETTKKAVGKVTETVVENVKGAASGVSEGFDSGRKQVTSADGAIVLGNAAEMEGKISVEILKVTGSQNDVFGGGAAANDFSVTIGFVNGTEQNYRVTNMTKDTVLALDKSGYVMRPRYEIPDVTIPAKANDKVDVTFSGEVGNFAKIRIFGKEYSLPEAK